MTQLNWIDDAARAGAELRQAIAEAHALLRDLRDIRREMAEMQATYLRHVREAAGSYFVEQFDLATSAYLADLEADTKRTYFDLEKWAKRQVDGLIDLVYEAVQKQMIFPSPANGSE